jgi:hypothetical protein
MDCPHWEHRIRSERCQAAMEKWMKMTTMMKRKLCKRYYSYFGSGLTLMAAVFLSNSTSVSESVIMDCFVEGVFTEALALTGVTKLS